MVGEISTEMQERFQSYVAKSDGCWEWSGARTGKGYGAIKLGGRMVPAHRVSWKLAFGPIPDGLLVLHRCDNRPCVRPDHLFLGTHADNMADMVAKDRQGAGERNHEAKLTWASVRQIRERYSATDLSCSELARALGVSKYAVQQIVKGRTWKDPAYHRPTTTKRRSWPRGARHHNAALTAAQVEELRRRRSAGELLKHLAARFGISIACAHDVARRKTYA